MLRDFTESLFMRLIDAFPPDCDYGRATLEQAAMPRPVAHFLLRTLQHRLDLETEALAAAGTDWFDYDHPDVQRAYRTFAAALAEHACIPVSAWSATLRRAVQQVTTHLVRPVETLVAFVFEDEHGRQPLPTVYERMGYFLAHPYLNEVTEAYFQQKQLQEIDRDRFAALLHRIDREMTQDYDTDAWMRLLAPLFDLAGRSGYEDGVPVELLRTFFGSKDAEEVQRRLRLAQERGRQALREDDLRALLEAPAPPEAPPAPQPTPARRPEPAAAGSGPQPAAPLWQQFQQPGSSREGPARIPPPPESTPAPPNRSHGQPLWMRFHAKPAAPAHRQKPGQGPAALDALERSVLGTNGTRNRALFVEHLFSGSAAEYERVLRLLQEASSWTEASQIIAQEVFRKHQVNIYSDPAIAFTDAVEAQYRAR